MANDRTDSEERRQFLGALVRTLGPLTALVFAGCSRKPPPSSLDPERKFPTNPGKKPLKLPGR